MPFKTLNKLMDVHYIHQQYTETFPFLLESTAKNAKIGRYDILFYKPQKIISSEQKDCENFLSSFDKLWKKHDEDEDGKLPKSLPFRGGWFVFLSYELAAQIESKLSLITPPYPVAYAAKIGGGVIVDKEKKCTYIISDLSDSGLVQKIEKLIDDLDFNKVNEQNGSFDFNLLEDDKQQFIKGVKTSKNYIKEGDVFQVNLSRAWSTQFNQHDTKKLYSSLRIANPAPFSASCYFTGLSENFSIFSSSPERLVSVKNRKIEVRPIAGTRPRRAGDQKDKAMATELINNTKERAEHTMLIDLERNDLGKISEPGSIFVDEFMTIESYTHVHHIVSNVVGKLRKEMTPSDIISAVFPGGTITGCPKVRCMEIIFELENTYRGAYTGSLGYVNHNGDMDMNILIRTFVHHSDQLSFRAGAGIVYDSVPEQELKETENKVKGLLNSFDKN